MGSFHSKFRKCKILLFTKLLILIISPACGNRRVVDASMILNPGLVMLVHGGLGC